MAQGIQTPRGELFLPGTCVPRALHVGGAVPCDERRRDAALRKAYADRALEAIPRLLGAIDRNPYRPTFGCLDREYWHYRTSSFPSEMYQEGALALALAATIPFAGNSYFGRRRVAELSAAAIRFAARSSHADGSCDDYYPFERALGAAVFSLCAATEAYRLLGLNDAELLDWFRRRAHWIAGNDESGRLANHHALAALGLLRVALVTGEETLRRAADAKIDRVLDWQHEEGWFEEYGGADLGYQTVTIDCLAKYREATGETGLDEPLARAVDFARAFLHPDGTYGGVYGSRGTAHFYAHGFELLARRHAAAAEMADGFLGNMAAGTDARLTDDRLHIHRVANLLEAYRDWSATAPGVPSSSGEVPVRHFAGAGLLVRRMPTVCTIVSTSRGGVFRHFAGLTGEANGSREDATARRSVSDAGLILEMADGRVAVSQVHDRSREGTFGDGPAESVSVTRELDWARFEVMSPAKQMVLYAGMCTVGRWCRSLVRRLLQRRLITGRRPAGIQLTRRFEWHAGTNGTRTVSLRVVDTIELLDPRLAVRRMGFGTDHESAYVAATGGYGYDVLQPWTDLAEHVERLNRERRVTVTREF